MQRISLAPVLSRPEPRLRLARNPAISRRASEPGGSVIASRGSATASDWSRTEAGSPSGQKHAVTTPQALAASCACTSGTAEHIAVLGVLDVVLDLDD